MEQRKTPKADLTKKRGLFMNLGLIMSLIFVISAFEWKFYDNLQTIDLGELNYAEEELLVIPNIVEPPTPPPTMIHDPIIKEVENGEEADPIKDMVINNDKNKSKVEITNFPPAPKPVVTEEPDKTDDPFLIVESMPEPEDGLEKFYKFLGKKMKYPKQARRIGREGRVFVQFVVDIDGSLTELKVIKGIGAGCDEEALRVLKLAPKWKPGKQRGRPVKVRMSIPITFRFN